MHPAASAAGQSVRPQMKGWRFTMKTYLILAGAACVCGLLLIVLRNSGGAKSLALNGIAGAAAMGVVNLFSGFTGVGLAVNAWSLLTAVLLGLPGVTGLLFLRLLWSL